LHNFSSLLSPDLRCNAKKIFLSPSFGEFC
jgi:hypothetical protein